MTRDEFKQKVLQMFREIDDNEDMEFYAQIVVFQDDIPVDIEVITNGCVPCHRNALELFIKQQHIQYTNSSKQQVH